MGGRQDRGEDREIGHDAHLTGSRWHHKEVIKELYMFTIGDIGLV